MEKQGLSALDASQLALQFTQNLTISPTKETKSLKEKLFNYKELELLLTRKMIAGECILEIGLEGMSF